jgi:hypothetical protein
MESGVYEFGGRKYAQAKMVWGQVKQLNAVIKGIQFPASGLTVPAIVELLGEEVPMVLAIILTEEGTSIKDKNLDALAADFEYGIPLDIIIQVFEDFFEINPITSVLEKLAIGVQSMRKKMEMAGVAVSITPSAS